ncbi:hypothetical protein HO173_008093 [Letharia columbiana]|uniref:Heterokaryon incompatibility domain-containing protein n=1 Tax=Letharia columbiana TaxID=112416 RepID=A0A8H6FSI6_9LECA|nr:uncharacterized protein HO173_008093 [Letharia columbiana]KAF6233881.1 hypothetical protein HO173_008093 [Letharia columbiana]
MEKTNWVGSASLIIASINTRTFLHSRFPLGKECAFYGLLRHALQDKHKDEKIAEAESDFHPEIRAKWPTSGWNGLVTVDRAVFSTEEDWTERDRSQATDQSLGGVHTLSLGFWPYPPRRNVSSPESKFTWVWSAVYADSDSEASLRGNIRRKKPHMETLSDANVLLISRWLSICSTLHIECRHKSDTRLPTRVIDVGPADNSQHPRLIVTSKESGEYVALSHCWGSLIAFDSRQHARTLKINPQRHVRWDTSEHVAPELSGGVLIVRKLQLRFLWIDALCIIQDDPADWAREAARMNDVYGLAYLTIAATSAISSTDGFLKRSQETTISIPYHKDVRAEPAGLLFLAYMRTGGDTRVLVF